MSLIMLDLYGIPAYKGKREGKRGGARIIYFNKDKDQLILEYIYKKSDIETLKLRGPDHEQT